MLLLLRFLNEINDLHGFKQQHTFQVKNDCHLLLTHNSRSSLSARISKRV